MNKIFIYSSNKYSKDTTYQMWYEFVTDDLIVIDKFKSMLYACSIYENPSYYVTPYCCFKHISFMTKNTNILSVSNLCDRIIREYDMKSCILNYNHENSIIKNVSRFIICSRGDYEVC